MYEKNITMRAENRSTQEALREELRKILASNRVYKTRAGFIVTSQDSKGNSQDFRITRNLRQDLVCVCKTYLDKSLNNPKFKCEHLQAVDLYLVAKLKTLEDLPEQPVQIKWHCHFLTQRSIKDLMKKITGHPEGKPLEELRGAIQKESGNKDAPEGLWQEGAERVELYLREWWMNLNPEEQEFDRAA